jgi:two-component system nitrogen regulation response regulator GlnG
MSDVATRIEDAAESDGPVLIEGEPGTGRELVARTIHYAGSRRAGDFVSVKATNIPRARLEEELISGRTLRRANGGTLLVKDLDTLPRGPQKSLARVLQRKKKEREESGEQLDIRVMGSTDGDLAQSVAAEYFDRELYEKLGARKICIPPLRRRLADLPRLIKHFFNQVGEEVGRTRVAITDRALDRLSKYPWPGNVAELKDVARRLVLRLKRGPVDVADVEAVLPQVGERIPVEDMAFEELVRAKLRGFLLRVDGYPVDNLYDDVISRVERPLLALVMEHAGQNQLRAAEILGLNRNTLRKKLAQHTRVSNLS